MVKIDWVALRDWLSGALNSQINQAIRKYEWPTLASIGMEIDQSPGPEFTRKHPKSDQKQAICAI